MFTAPSNFLKAAFHKFDLVHSWILCPILKLDQYLQTVRAPQRWKEHCWNQLLSLKHVTLFPSFLKKISNIVLIDNILYLNTFILIWVFFSIVMVTRSKTTKNRCNSALATIYCAVGEKSEFKMLNSNKSWHKILITKRSEL